jgi:hypothetical protein
MQRIRTLTLLAMLAIAASALATPSAFAQNEPLPHNQTPRLIVNQEVHAAADTFCPLVTPSPAPVPGPTTTGGGCRIHVTGSDIEFWGATPGGAEPLYWQCDMEFVMRLDAAAEGYMSHLELTPGSLGQCTLKPCRNPALPASEDRAWSVSLRDAEASPEAITFLICIVYQDQPLHCEHTLPFVRTGQHRYAFNAPFVTSPHGGSSILPCRLRGAFSIETVSEVTGEAEAEQLPEIRHS